MQVTLEWSFDVFLDRIDNEHRDNVISKMALESLPRIGQVWSFESPGIGMDEIYLKVVNCPISVDAGKLPNHIVKLEPCENDTWDSPLIKLDKETTTKWAEALVKDHGWNFSL